MQMSMILNEALRLYPPVVVLTREACKDVRIRGLNIPAGTHVSVTVTAVHHDVQLWGEDAHEFNPWRFKEPRKHLASFFPFGLGPKTCVAQNLAVIESKVALAIILQQYSFLMSPTYVHAPLQYLTMLPQYGAQILFTRISTS